jgi:hypothetical protein
MAETNNKLKPKFLISVEKQTRLSIQISQKTSDLIEDYRAFHKDVSGEEVTTDALISAVIISALASDKSFVKWRRDKAGSNNSSINSDIP